MKTQNTLKKMQTKVTNQTYYTLLNSPHVNRNNIDFPEKDDDLLNVKSVVSDITNNIHNDSTSIQTQIKTDLRKQIEMLEAKDKEI